MVLHNLLNITPDNSLLPDGVKPFPEPSLASVELYDIKQIVISYKMFNGHIFKLTAHRHFKTNQQNSPL